MRSTIVFSFVIVWTAAACAALAQPAGPAAPEQSAEKAPALPTEQPAKQPAEQGSTEAAPAMSAEDRQAAAALKANAKTFAEAFARHDAQAIAQFWTEDGDYVDDQGHRLQGREAIEKEYKNLFAMQPQAVVRVSSDSVHVVAPGVAVEDGTIVMTPAPQMPPLVSRFTAVHVKQGDKWRISNVRETRFNTTSNQAHLQDLSWLVGRWRAQKEDMAIDVTCQWGPGHAFLERRYEVTSGEQAVVGGLQVVAWDPTTERVTSWSFASDGGHGMGVWTRDENSWIEESVGVLADGTRTKATNILTRRDDNTLEWKSVDRMAGDAHLPDAMEVVLQRVEAEQ